MASRAPQGQESKSERVKDQSYLLLVSSAIMGLMALASLTII